MNLIIAIINDDDFRGLSEALIKAEFQSTRLSSTGSFLRSGNSTLLMCVEDERLDECIEIIHTHCRKRKQLVASPALHGAFPSYPVEVIVGGATVLSPTSGGLKSIDEALGQGYSGRAYPFDDTKR